MQRNVEYCRRKCTLRMWIKRQYWQGGRINEKKVLQVAMSMAMGGAAVGAWAFNVGDVLSFDPGRYDCVIGGTYPICDYDASAVTSGSYFAMDFNGDGKMDLNERTPIAPGPAGGIIIGILQPASGSHSGCPDGSEVAGLDAPWCFFGNTGMHQTVGYPVMDNGDGTLDFSGWGVTWNGIAHIPLGGDSANFPSDTGRALVSCSSTPCVQGEPFTVDYSAHVPNGDPSGFGGITYWLHLERVVAAPSATISLTVGGGAVQECSTAGGSSVAVTAAATVPDGDAVDSIVWSVDGSVVASGASVELFLELGTHVVSAEVQTIGGLSATTATRIVVQDTVAPDVTAAFIDRKHKTRTARVVHRGRVEIQAEADDVCDPDPVIEAIIGAAVEDGDMLRVAKRKGWVSLQAQGLDLTVRASDASGNTATAKAVLNIAE
ncbi:hypothetical protein QVG61_12010 [Thiohalobacter sp. IOR34]|uniref:hypothetical protein n=1 Tax=Thiohalobacter sp. IOR34 TaxID=3057176 RepID=UPI0025B263C3|nr:hypothetical protein [Thiohalobacter sp. IOR34]WJW75202.1 hypothetical protein QVG61_12010 [Thiohalobacter sp. IOR34]